MDKRGGQKVSKIVLGGFEIEDIITSVVRGDKSVKTVRVKKVGARSILQSRVPSKDGTQNAEDTLPKNCTKR